MARDAIRSVTGNQAVDVVVGDLRSCASVVEPRIQDISARAVRCA